MTKKKFQKTIPGHDYKIGLGVNQTELIGKAANMVNETPKDFLKRSALEAAQAQIEADNICKK
ncbi:MULTISPECIES: hypothetical protein [Enterobacter]|uniref:hypothetical protein n=1 Tax=Enterobacter kobei TaxID=208224 RepID=UPI003B893F0C